MSLKWAGSKPRNPSLRILTMDGVVRSSLQYFFPGSCYKTVVEELAFSNGRDWLSGNYILNFYFSDFSSTLPGDVMQQVAKPGCYLWFYHR